MTGELRNRGHEQSYTEDYAKRISLWQAMGISSRHTRALVKHIRGAGTRPVYDRTNTQKHIGERDQKKSMDRFRRNIGQEPK